MNKTNYTEIISQLQKELNSECAIANSHGIVLSSKIKEFSQGKIIPQKILSLISNSQDIAKELSLKKINSFVVEAEKYNYLFTFNEGLILISKLGLDVNLAKFMPSIRLFLDKLSEESKKYEIKKFSIFDFSKEIKNMEASLSKGKIKDKKYSVIKDLVNYISDL
ncbi:MAG: hypothetical protein ACTSV5_13610 [Promethearchaeota archaeon]